MDEKAGQRVEMSETLARCTSLARAIAKLDPAAKPVRVVAFNKSQDTNWGVPWHQDRVISVAQKHEVDGFKNWALKTGVWHCEPPQDQLETMLFVRVHLDDTDETNDALKIAVGSHSRGIVPAAEAENIAAQFPLETCDAKRGDVLILKMLTCHSSAPSQSTAPRRVLRIDYAPAPLPEPLAWS